MIDPYQREPDGTFARQHKDKMLDLARHEEAAKRKEHPLNRIGDVTVSAKGIVIHTTDIHLPRQIDGAIQLHSMAASIWTSTRTATLFASTGIRRHKFEAYSLVN